MRLQSGPFWTLQGTTSTGNRRADYIGGDKYKKDNRFTLANHQAQWINPAAFKAAGNGTFGNSGVGTIVMPGLEQSDVTLSKLFDFHERVQLKLQADAFNVLNHTNYSSLGTNVTSSGFGALNGAYPNRQMQFGGKIIF